MIKRRFQVPLIIAIILILCASGSSRERGIPELPSKITFDTLKWDIPVGTPYRTVLKNGLRAYIAVDSTLPIVKMIGYVRYGSLLDPAQRFGEGTLMATLMRTGGTGKYQADTLDALLDEYAISIGFSMSETALTFNASFLSQYTDTALEFLEQMLFHPAFDKKKMDKEVKIIHEQIRHRFDNPGPTLDIAYEKIMYPKQPSSRLITEQTLARITRKDCIDLHKKIIKSGNIIVAVSGKFDRNIMTARIEKMFPADISGIDSTFPSISIAPASKGLMVYKPISQAYVRIGMPMFKRPHQDYYPMSVLSLILGGGGFTSRLGTKVRSDEGLTYSIYSDAESNYIYPGTFYIEYYTKNETFTRATALTLDEVAKLRKDGVTEKELKDAKDVLVGELPSMFRTPYDIVSTYAWNEYYGRPQDHFVVYPKKIRELKREDIQRVSQKYLNPDLFTFTVVGDTAALAKQRDSEGFSYSSITPRKTIIADSIAVQP